MRYIPLNDNLNQKHSIDLNGNKLNLNVVFNKIGSWFFNLDFNQRQVFSVKLSTGVFHLESSNFPFDFIVFGEGGLDPYKTDDFIQRCRLYLVEKSEVEAIKGTEIRV